MVTATDDDDQLAPRTLLAITGLAILGGLVAGFVGGWFRWALVHAATLRDDLSRWAHDFPFGVLVPVLVTAALAAFAAWLVNFAPRASGSGIQDVEAVYRNQMDPPPIKVLFVRFFGGLASIGSGMVLGREGPTVHMAATIGASAGRLGRLRDRDARALQTAMAGAGLAVAFNAPIGGALFALEEVTKSARMRILVPTVFSVGAAVVTLRLVLGDHPDFSVSPVAVPKAATMPLFVIFGILVGVLGACYNTVIMFLMRLAKRLSRIPAPARAGAVGALVGLALFIDPLVVGGGDAVTQLLLSGHAIALPVLLLYAVVRFFIGPLSYAAGTPGGLFAPMLALGTLLGVIFSRLVEAVLPGTGSELAIAFAIVGMSTLFTATVRAPLTGVALIMEMTATTSVALPMLLAGGSAFVVATLMRSEPVYDSLRELMLAGHPPDARGGGAPKGLN